jgi:hypothetical protein
MSVSELGTAARAPLFSRARLAKLGASSSLKKLSTISTKTSQSLGGVGVTLPKNSMDLRWTGMACQGTPGEGGQGVEPIDIRGVEGTKDRLGSRFKWEATCKQGRGAHLG